MACTTAVGLTVYFVSHRLIAKYQRDDLIDPTSSLFRVIGMLVSLMLSLAFADVIAELKSIEAAVEQEAVAISDTFHDLERYGREETRDVRALVVEYTQAVIDDDWPALANDRLGERAGALRAQLASGVLQLKPGTEAQKALWTRIVADVDAISDHRVVRLNNTLSTPPGFFFVIILGFLITMACFGAYRPQPPVVTLLGLATAFVGLVLYLILSLSDPFQSGVLEPTTLEYLVDSLRADL
jgi:hypothetical protein